MKKKILLIAISFSIPVILISAFMIYLLEVPIKTKFVEEHSTEFHQHVDYVNNTLQQLETYIYNWGNSSKEDFIMYYAETTNNYKEFEDASERLFHLENTSPLIKSALLTVQGEDPFYVSPGGTWLQTDRSRHPVVDSLDSDQAFQWIRNEDGNKTELYFTQNLAEIENNQSLFLIVSIDLNQIANMLQVAVGSEGGFSAYYMNGDPLVVTSPLTSDIRNHISNEVNPISFISINGSDHSFVNVSKERFNHEWSFYSIVPVSHFIQPIQFLSRLLFYISLFLIIGTALFAYYFSKKQYQPIYDLISDMTGDKDDFDEISTNAIEYLKKQWDNLQEERNLLVAQSKDHDKRAKRNVITRIIKGDFDYYSEEELLNLLETRGWNSLRQGYRLYSVQLTEYVESRRDAEKKAELAGFILNNLMSDISEKHFTESAIINSSRHVFYLFVPNATCKGTNEDTFIEDVFHNVNSIIKRYVTICTTDILQEIKELPKAFESLSYNRLFHEMKTENQVLGPNHNEMDAGVRTTYPIHYEEKIINSFRNKNKEELLQHTESFIQTMMDQSNIQIYLLEAVKQLYDSISYLLMENGILHDEYIAKEALLNQMEEHFTLDSLTHELYHSFLTVAFEHYFSIADSNTRNKIMQLRDYLHQHYNDPNLSLERSADELQIDPSVLSREFKRYVGISYIDYITDIRIEKAKSLLLNSDRKVNEIATIVGYNSSYFNRLFKRKVGVTPGSYRTQNSSTN